MPGQREALDALMQQYLALRYAGDPPARESLRAFRRAARDFHAPRVVQ
jgi:hypothetical protein